MFRNSYSDETFNSQIVPVTLQAGENTIRIYNDNSKVITNGIHQGGDRVPANISYNVLENYTPNFDKFVFYPLTAESEVTETDTYRVTTVYSDGGMVSADQSEVEAGGTVRFTFTPDDDAVLTEATVNGESIMDRLSQYGGVYILSAVQSDVTVRAYFQAEAQAGTEEIYYYSVNCGDIDPHHFKRRRCIRTEQQRDGSVLRRRPGDRNDVGSSGYPGAGCQLSGMADRTEDLALRK